MAKTKVNIKNVIRNIEAVFEKSVKSEKLLNEIKDNSVLRIQAETRKGKDLTQDGKPQPDLSEATLRIREQIAKGNITLSYPEDSQFFKKGKSNLTLTGQMLDSIRGKVDAAKGLITIFVGGNRSRVRYFWSRTGVELKHLSKDSIGDNSSLAKDLAKRGRTFLGLDTTGVKLIRKRVLDEIRKQIRLRKFTKT